MSNKYLNFSGLSWFLEKLKSIFPTKEETVSIKDAEIILNTMKLLQEHISILEMKIDSCECGNRSYFVDSDGSYITTDTGDLILID